MRTPWALTLLQGTKKCCVRLATAILQADNDYDHVRISINMITIILEEYSYDYDHMIFWSHIFHFAVFPTPAFVVMFVNIWRQVNDSMEAKPTETGKNESSNLPPLPEDKANGESLGGFRLQMALPRSLAGNRNW